MAVSVAVTKVWPVEKYARFVSDAGQPAASLEGKRGGVWQHYSSKDGVIQMALLASNHLMVSTGNQIYESFSLWETRKWIKGVTKGDSLLFLYRLKDENRKFRVKFSSVGPNTSSLETCRNCIAALTDLVPIREMSVPLSGSSSTGAEGTNSGWSDSQLPSGYEDTQLMSQPTHEASLLQDPIAPTAYTTSKQGGAVVNTLTHTRQQCDVPPSKPPQGAVSTAVSGRSTEEGERVIPDDEMMSIPDIAKEATGNKNAEGYVVSGPHELPKTVLSEPKSLGRAYAETNFPTEQLGAFIRLCLTDANFPAFVEAVEKELNSITTNK